MIKHLIIVLFCISSLSVLGQCVDENWHNTSNNSIWLSCQKTINPLTELGQSHWILYEFEKVQAISDLRIWNLSNPNLLSSGAKKIRMDVSEDGITWTNLGDIDLDIANSGRSYTGEEERELGMFQAQYILMTVLENYGGPCSGIAEIRFNLGSNTVATVDQELSSRVNISPNPVDQYFTISLNGIQTKKIQYQIVDIVGRIILQNNIDTYSIKNEFDIDGSSLPDGHYSLRIDTDIGTIAKQIIVVHP